MSGNDMEMELQRVLRSGEMDPMDLEQKYAIHFKPHRLYPNLLLFKYDQIDSPMGEKIVQESRGVILDQAAGWRCVARPFDKFFNHGEGHAAKIDWQSAYVEEKVDGSLITMYEYDDAWRVATSGTPDASGEVNGFGITFATLFWQVWAAKGYECPAMIDRGWTFLFELTGPMNRVVVDHKEAAITWLAARNRRTGEYYKMHGARKTLPLTLPPKVRIFPLQTPEQIMATFETMNPFAQEGYVVVDGTGKRVKVKHPGYVAAHHMKDGYGPRRILEVVRAGESSEFLLHFPEFKAQFEKTLARYNSLVKEIEEAYARIRDIKEQKSFALEAVKTRMSAPLFQLRAGKISRPTEYLSTMNIQTLMDVLKLKDDVNVEGSAAAAQ